MRFRSLHLENEAAQSDGVVGEIPHYARNRDKRFPLSSISKVFEGRRQTANPPRCETMRRVIVSSLLYDNAVTGRSGNALLHTQPIPANRPPSSMATGTKNPGGGTANLTALSRRLDVIRS
jgi:hypothetical protein